jgi:hypothetical protein
MRLKIKKIRARSEEEHRFFSKNKHQNSSYNRSFEKSSYLNHSSKINQYMENMVSEETIKEREVLKIE